MQTAAAAAVSAGTTQATVALAAAALNDDAAQAASAPALAPPAEIVWLDNKPDAFGGATWGTPWPRGAVKAGTAFTLRDAESTKEIPVQSWAMATWPDGSLKWTGHAVGPDAGAAERFLLVPGAVSQKADAAKAPSITVSETDDYFDFDTGVINCRVAKRGEAVFSAIERGRKTVAVDGKLICLRRNTPDVDDAPVTQETFVGQTRTATLEQSGPLRAVVRLEGAHQAAQKGGKARAWLPFTVRLVFYAGGESVQIFHTFVFDGDENVDFISGLGVRFGVPMGGELHDRHVRFAGENGGLWAEAVQGLTGLRRDPGATARAAQIAGQRAVQLVPLADAVETKLNLIPAWNDVTLFQPTENGFQIKKRTKPGHGWVRSASGRRAAGLGYVGGANTFGGVAFGMRDFWQKYPAQMDIRNAAGHTAEVTLWLWSPDAPPMDLRFYHDGMGMETHAQENLGLDITYEDYEKGWGTPHGVARTSEMTLWALPGTPPRERFSHLANALQNPPRLVCAPAYLHCAGVFGNWGLPDRRSAAKAQIENQLDYLIDLFQKQVEQRHWYGFWDYGDFMHSYDSDRHEWKYDVGGFAWANSELSPDLWLWYSFLRTGRADIFRLAEAMTRHTGEVDVYHLGRFAGFGSRHNVQHWGDSSKQPRVSTAAYRRIFYYLTADERAGDLMRELLYSDEQLTKIVIGRKLGDVPGRDASAPPDPNSTNPAHAAFGTDWCSFAAAWLTEWERTGDTKWRDKIVNGMRSIAALPRGWLAGGAEYDPKTGKFSGPGDTVSVSHLNAVFGAVEINAELLNLLDVPEYEKAWLLYCRYYNAPPDEKARLAGVAAARPLNLRESHSRLTAYAAKKTKDPVLASRAWGEFYSGEAGVGVHADLVLRRINGSAVLNPLDEGFGMSTNAASQWSLTAIQNLALIGDYLPPDHAPTHPATSNGEPAA